MATEKAETDRVPVTLALSTISYLEKLVRQGTHGTSVPGVAKTLIEEGIRLAIKDGLLSIRDNGRLPDGNLTRNAAVPIRIWNRSMFANIPTWTTERVELLKQHFESGLSCREIAAHIGVSRNAVIGKLTRLGLTRGPTNIEQHLQGHPGTQPGNPFPARSTGCCKWSTRTGNRPRDAPIASERPCSLLELSHERCRWPISTPGAEDFCFCGNTPLKGMPYCSGHTRLAYKPGSRQRVMRG